jgi:hypothetical protein
MPSPAAPAALETGLYVYAVVPALEGGEPGLEGIDDAPVQFIRHGSLAAAVGRIALDRPPGRSRELVAHNDVVNTLAEAGPVIPVRFGSVMQDAQQVVEELLAADHDRFVDTLERLRGTTQLNLRATYVEGQVLAEVVRDRPDIAELRQRTRQLPAGTMHPDLVRLGELVAHEMEARRAEDADMVAAAVGPFARALSERAGGGVDHVVDLAVLLASDQVGRLEAVLEDLAEAVHERIHLELTGPLPPYDFAGDDSWD